MSIEEQPSTALPLKPDFGFSTGIAPTAMHGTLPQLLASGSSSQILQSEERAQAVAAAAEEDARWAVANPSLREAYTNQHANIWNEFEQLWEGLAGAYESKDTALSESSKRSLAFGLSKLQRNLIAGVQSHQEALYPAEPQIRRVVYHLTSFFRIEDPNFYPLHRAITQLLSNLISPAGPNDELLQKTLPVYLDGTRENDIIIRLLDSLDARTNWSVLVLLENAVRDSPERLGTVISSASGLAWLKRIVGKMDDWMDGGGEVDACFNTATTIFRFAIEQERQAELFQLFGSSDDVVTPHQTTLLKIVHSIHNSIPSTSTNHFLLTAFSDLTRYCATSIKSGLDDPRLPKVFEALVLTTECLTEICLRSHEFKEDLEAKGIEDELKDEPKQVVETVIGLLRALEVFIPRIKPGLEAPTDSDVIPFPYLKRDLVRLLGVLSFEDKSIGDRVRAVEGVEVILGLCVTDERNPYLREHALFAVKNLLYENEENQDILRKMEPLGVVGDNGELLPLPDNLKKGTK